MTKDNKQADGLEKRAEELTMRLVGLCMTSSSSTPIRDVLLAELLAVQEAENERCARIAQTFKWTGDDDREVSELIAHRIRASLGESK